MKFTSSTRKDKKYFNKIMEIKGLMYVPMKCIECNNPGENKVDL